MIFLLPPLVFCISEILSYSFLDWPIFLFPGVPIFVVIFYVCNLFRLLDKRDVSQGNWGDLFCYLMYWFFQGISLFIPTLLQHQPVAFVVTSPWSVVYPLCCCVFYL